MAMAHGAPCACLGRLLCWGPIARAERQRLALRRVRTILQPEQLAEKSNADGFGLRLREPLGDCYVRPAVFCFIDLNFSSAAITVVESVWREG
jgi:hypothetical protein